MFSKSNLHLQPTSWKHKDFADSSIRDLYRESASQSSSVASESGDFGPHVFQAVTETGTDEGDMDMPENFSSKHQFILLEITGAVSTTCFTHSDYC